MRRRSRLLLPQDSSRCCNPARQCPGKIGGHFLRQNVGREECRRDNLAAIWLWYTAGYAGDQMDPVDRPVEGFVDFAEFCGTRQRAGSFLKQFADRSVKRLLPSPNAAARRHPLAAAITVPNQQQLAILVKG